MEKILAIDYGLARVGLALSYGSLAEPLIVLANDETLLEKIQSLCAQNSVTQLLVGVSEQEMAERTKEFAEALKTELPLPVRLHDETLSSAEVHKKLAQKNKGKKQYRGPIDHFAAAVILQDYLDQQA